MDKKRLKVALVVLNAVKIRFPTTKEFIDDTQKDKCQKEKITPDEVIFYKSRSKELAQKIIFLVSMLTLKVTCSIFCFGRHFRFVVK